MRTKEQLAKLLSEKHVDKSLKASTWADFVRAVQSVTPEQKAHLLKLVINGQDKMVGKKLHQALLTDARIRARQEVENMLSDDSLDLTQLDKLL